MISIVLSQADISPCVLTCKSRPCPKCIGTRPLKSGNANVVYISPYIVPKARKGHVLSNDKVVNRL